MVALRTEREFERGGAVCVPVSHAQSSPCLASRRPTTNRPHGCGINTYRVVRLFHRKSCRHPSLSQDSPSSACDIIALAQTDGRAHDNVLGDLDANTK